MPTPLATELEVLRNLHEHWHEQRKAFHDPRNPGPRKRSGNASPTCTQANRRIGRWGGTALTVLVSALDSPHWRCTTTSTLCWTRCCRSHRRSRSTPGRSSPRHGWSDGQPRSVVATQPRLSWARRRAADRCASSEGPLSSDATEAVTDRVRVLCSSATTSGGSPGTASVALIARADGRSRWS